jgi:hypothetical protein
MLVLFMRKSRASCRFLHSPSPGPEKVQPLEPNNWPGGGTKSCILSGLETLSPISRDEFFE